MVEIMRKLLLLFSLASVMACTQQDTTEQGVVINGIRWATRNVDTPGTFTANPQDFGGYFNRNQAQSVCPEGWRVPTGTELESLLFTLNTWTSKGGANGHLFGSQPYQIFLPAAGMRWGYASDVEEMGIVGKYWSVTTRLNEVDVIGFSGITTERRRGSVFFVFDRDDFLMDWIPEQSEDFLFFSVRCVAMTYTERAQAQREAEERREAEARAVFDEGVVINGVRWATRNVDAPGTFAVSPESTGMFYQWNRRRGWAARGNVTGWDRSIPTGDTWERENDPCPEGWRVPTSRELAGLLYSAGDVFSIRWTTKNGVRGVFFGTAPYQIFLPIAGSRRYTDGMLRGVRDWYWGIYWSNTGFDNERAIQLSLYCSACPGVYAGFSRREGLTIRCVAE